VLGDIIEPRVAEILSLAHREIIKSGYEDLLAAGVILTGGTSNIEGIIELGEQIFNMPVRRGYPVGVGGIVDIINNPIYATGVGLVIHGSKNRSEILFKKKEKKRLSEMAKSMKRWFDDFF